MMSLIHTLLTGKPYQPTRGSRGVASNGTGIIEEVEEKEEKLVEVSFKHGYMYQWWIQDFQKGFS